MDTKVHGKTSPQCSAQIFLWLLYELHRTCVAVWEEEAIERPKKKNINADGGYVYIDIFHCSHVLLIQHKVSFQLRDGARAFTPAGFLSPGTARVKVLYCQPAQTLPHSFLRYESSSSSCQSCQNYQKCSSVHPVSLNLLYLGTESPFCVRSTSLLPEPDPSPGGFHGFDGRSSWVLDHGWERKHTLKFPFGFARLDLFPGSILRGVLPVSGLHVTEQ